MAELSFRLAGTGFGTAVAAPSPLPGSVVRIGGCYSGVVSVRDLLLRQLDRTLAGFKTGHFFGRSGDPAERVAEIWKVDQRKQQASYPEDVHVREESNEAQDGDNFKLDLVRFVGHSFGQGMQAKKMPKPKTARTRNMR